MEVELYKDPRSFIEAAEGWMAEDPFSTSVIGVFTRSIVSGRRQIQDDYLWLAARDQSGEVVGAAMHTPPFSVFLPRLPAGVSAAMAERLLEAQRCIPGVNGELEAVNEFAEVWGARTGTTSKVERAMRQYRLGTLVWPEGVEGAPRLAEQRDAGLVAAWLADFQDETATTPVFDLEAEAKSKIAAGLVWLWEDPEDAVVSLAGVSEPAAGVARIGPVYTPPERRRHGYGAAVTAAATDAGLRSGAEHVVLYTDLANPISNSIYRKIGYLPDHDAEERVIVPRQ